MSEARQEAQYKSETYTEGPHLLWLSWWVTVMGGILGCPSKLSRKVLPRFRAWRYGSVNETLTCTWSSAPGINVTALCSGSPDPPKLIDFRELIISLFPASNDIASGEGEQSEHRMVWWGGKPAEGGNGL